MPKNTQGGSSHKKFARKHNLGGFNKNKLRISEDEGELYAIVTKLLGNGMFHCHCIDDTLRLGHIRGKFSGRGKRDNMVEAGKWVLIGLREWDVPSEKTSMSLTTASKKIQQCDLLEVKGSSFRIKCKLCGLGGSFGIVTSTHKLAYGHFLGKPGNDIRPCVCPETLQRDQPTFYAELKVKGDALAKKRQ